MTENPNFVPGHILNSVVPAHGLDFMDQTNVSPNADGSTQLLAVRTPEAAGAIVPNPTLKPIEITALTYAYQRTMAQIHGNAPSSRRGLGRHRGLNSRGGSWGTSSARPMHLSGSTVSALQQVDPRNPTATLIPLLRAFKGIENDGNQMNFVRKTDMSVIHQLQYRHGISKTMPKPSIQDRRRNMGPQRYHTLKMPASSKEVVAYTIKGNQVKDMAQAAGLRRVLKSRPGSSRDPNAYHLLNQEAMMAIQGPTPPKKKKQLDKKLAREVKPANHFAGFFPAPSPS